jgi:recombinational DNA repair protein (RecF pathway)
MHHIYTTDSIILKREPQDTSAYYYILTRDLGLIKARAQGVRGVKSRLKGALQEFSLSTIAYVHGKAGWKITTAIPEKNFFNEIKNSDPKRADDTARRAKEIMARISDCLIRFITGEEKSVDIFTVTEKGFSVLAENTRDASAVEIVILVRILHTLGYVASDDVTKTLLQEYDTFQADLLSYVLLRKKELVQIINKAFKESQM